MPGSEGALLEVAETRGMAGLREEARRVVLGSMDRNELDRRQVAARSVRHWVDGEGMVAGQFRLPPGSGSRSSIASMPRRIECTDAARKLGSTEAA